MKGPISAGGPQGALLMVRALSIGGCERDLTKMALALDRSRYQPHVACFRPDGPRFAELAAAGVPILHVPVESFASWSAVRGAWQLGHYIRRHRIRVLHAFDVPTDLFGAPVAKLVGVPAIITCQLSFRSLYTPREIRLLRLTDRLSHKVVVNSRAVKEDLLTRGVAADKLVVSHNGVDAKSFYRDPNAQRVPEVAGASIVVGTICVLRQEKRIDLLLTGFSRLRVDDPRRIKLLIVGSGAKESEWRELSERLGLADRCIFVPAQGEVSPWLRSMDIFVAPSESESFPNALLEAMASGCCVVGASVGGIPELITDGQNGLLFPGNDVEALGRKLQMAIEDASLRARLGEAAERTAHQEFSMDAAARRTEALYDSLLQPE